MKIFLLVFAMICTVIATLTALVFCMAGGANSTPAQIRTLKFWMAGVSLLGAAGVMAGVILMRAGQPGWATFASIAPTIIFGILLVIALLK
jgi:hypothetical protein